MMTEKIKVMLENLKTREYRKQRQTGCKIDTEHYWEINEQIEVFRTLAQREKPILFENDFIGFNRATDCGFPTRDGNITPNYARVITLGFDRVIEDIKETIGKTEEKEKREYGEAMLSFMDISLEIAEKYRDYAREAGNERLYGALSRIPHRGAESFYEALVFMKFCIYALRLYGASHLTLGRFDRYMYPFYLKDKGRGVSDSLIFEDLEEFFISLNYDTDLYFGVQQGDNGQSMVLGGYDRDGESMYNELTKMCMQASLELCLIDPKINLRVSKKTPDELYEYATLLTKKGLGFPQYCNDDVVVPGLIKLGYAPEDAVDYVVAACWEYIVPNCGGDIPNFHVMDFPSVVNKAVRENLLMCNDFEELLEHVRRGIVEECDRLIEDAMGARRRLMPFLSVFTDGCIESLTDIWRHGCKYMNYGCHGTGIANATDALAAVKKTVYDDKVLEKQELLDALEADFEGFAEVRSMLRECPKMGNNDDYADGIADALMRNFADNMNNRDNGMGGIWRAGTGSAMEYLWKGEKCPATADGRKAGETYSSSFSPSLDVKTSGLLSVIQSFSRFDMTEIINGGPLTLEIHDTVLKNDVGIKKVAQLVKHFILLGGHQLQLNSVNRERLLDAQKHPENYPNLIVRVWGWSGYFNELDVKYQNHIIRRCEYGM